MSKHVYGAVVAYVGPMLSLGVMGQGGMFNICTMARGPQTGPGAIWVPGSRAQIKVLRVSTPLGEKEIAGFGEEGRSLFYLGRLPFGGRGKLSRMGLDPTWKPGREVWIYFWALFYSIGPHV